MLALCLSSLWWTAEAGDTCAAEIYNTNYNGADHRQATGSTYADCCEMCSRSAGCTFWVFDTGQKLCHMKAHKGAPIIGPKNFVSGSVSASGGKTISLAPSDPRIKYSGRFDHSNPAAPQFAWVMTGVGCTVLTTATDPTSLTVMLTAPKDGARMRVMINGTLAGFVHIQKWPNQKGGRMQSYALANITKVGTHLVEVYKATEDNTRKNRKGVMIAVGETVILLHPPLLLVGVSIRKERGCQ